jgi:hypothetical protein
MLLQVKVLTSLAESTHCLEPHQLNQMHHQSQLMSALASGSEQANSKVEREVSVQFPLVMNAPKKSSLNAQDSIWQMLLAEKVTAAGARNPMEWHLIQLHQAQEVMKLAESLLFQNQHLLLTIQPLLMANASVTGSILMLSELEKDLSVQFQAALNASIRSDLIVKDSTWPTWMRMKVQQAVGARGPMVLMLECVLTRHQDIKLAESNLCQTTTMKMKFALEIGFEQTTSVNSEREVSVQFSPKLSASQKSKINVKDLTWLKSAEAEMDATARNLTVKKLPLTKLMYIQVIILAGSYLLSLLLLLLHYLILSSMMDVNLIGSKQIISELVRNLLVIQTHLLDVSQKVKLNAQQNLIL